MRWETNNSPLGEHSITIQWTDYELSKIDLDSFELALLRECDPSISLADALLVLAMVVRKIEQVLAKKGKA